MTKKKEKYESLEAKSARGIYTIVDPLDYLMLGGLPDQGELVMGYYPMVATAAQLAKETFQGKLTATQLAADIRRLVVQGLIVKVKARGTTAGYQRTKKGKELLENWKKAQGETK